MQVSLAPQFDVAGRRCRWRTPSSNQLAARNNVDVARESLRNALGLAGPLDFDIADTLAVATIGVNKETAVEAA